MKSQYNFLFLLITILGLFNACREKNDRSDYGPMIVYEGELVDFSKKDSLNLELSSTLIFDGSRRWQLVASSQNYQTNYAIYGQFILDEKKSNKDEVLLSRMNLKIVNYKSSPVELGLLDFDFTRDLNSNEARINIYLKGLTAKREISKKYDNPIRISNNSIITTERFLQPIFEIKNEIELSEIPEFQRYEYIHEGDTTYYKPVGYFYTGFKNGYLKDSISVFDSEFFYKDGIYVLAKPNFDAQIEKKYLEKYQAPGFRCKTATFVGKIQFDN